MNVEKQSAPTAPALNKFEILYLPPLGYGTPERLAIRYEGKMFGPFTYPEADDLTDLLLAFRRHHPPGFATALQIVADHYDVDVQQMVDRCRVPSVAWARQVAMSLCSQIFNQDSKHLARVFSCHHSRVRAARKRILEHQKNPEGRVELEAIRAKIKTALLNE